MKCKIWLYWLHIFTKHEWWLHGFFPVLVRFVCDYIQLSVPYFVMPVSLQAIFQISASCCQCCEPPPISQQVFLSFNTLIPKIQVFWNMILSIREQILTFWRSLLSPSWGWTTMKIEAVCSPITRNCSPINTVTTYAHIHTLVIHNLITSHTF